MVNAISRREPAEPAAMAVSGVGQAATVIVDEQSIAAAAVVDLELNHV